jgi:glyoxylase-like metal-dependent hydrolase (beta-lactamase superfamily II)
MIEEILKNIYKIQIPLTGNPLNAMNSYVFKGVERTLIVDVGWNQNACRDATLKALGKIGVDLQKTDFFVTHFHADHIGLLPKLVQGFKWRSN